jgi:hypothetical protein
MRGTKGSDPYWSIGDDTLSLRRERVGVDARDLALEVRQLPQLVPQVQDPRGGPEQVWGVWDRSQFAFASHRNRHQGACNECDGAVDVKKACDRPTGRGIMQKRNNGNENGRVCCRPPKFELLSFRISRLFTLQSVGVTRVSTQQLSRVSDVVTRPTIRLINYWTTQGKAQK